MAGLKSVSVDAENIIVPGKSGRRVVLFGSIPHAKKITAGIKRQGVDVVNSVSELTELAATENISDKNKQINSIIVMVCTGDETSAAADIYKVASQINVLVTTIIVYNPRCMPNSDSSSLAELRAASDMVVITSDENYLEYMLDCLL